jgi:Protein of unknown function (DUF1822)
MNYQPASMLNFTDSIDWLSFNETRTKLLPEHIRKAAHFSESIYSSQQRWQSYLCALGVLGFEEWLKERAPDLSVETEGASIWQPEYANLIAVASNISIGSFKLCIITSNNFSDEHSIPFAVFDIPRFAANFYVLMQVEEEEEQVAVLGFMTYKQFRSHQQTAGLHTKFTIDKDWTYQIPETHFNPDSNDLLLNLRCLDADAIQLSVKTQDVQNQTLLALQEKLGTLKSQLQIKRPWELLTVEEGLILLSHQNLIKYIYEATLPSSVQALINVGLWFNNQIDTLARELGWMLMPSLLVASELRSLREDFELIRNGLEQQSIHIPSTARGAYRDLEWEGGSFRLYAITWVLSETFENQEWMLLIALGPNSEGHMPKTLKLEVGDEIQLLFAQSLPDTSEGILYAQVIGNWNERFWVTVTADEKTVIELPPFGLVTGDVDG